MKFFRWLGLFVASAGAILAHNHPTIWFWLLSAVGFLVFTACRFLDSDYRGKLCAFSQFVGWSMNALVVFANNGYMPVKFAIDYAPTGCWRLALPTDKFLFFCDRFGANWAVFSIGDAFIIGSIIFLFLPLRKETQCQTQPASIPAQ